MVTGALVSAVNIVCPLLLSILLSAYTSCNKKLHLNDAHANWSANENF